MNPYEINREIMRALKLAKPGERVRKVVITLEAGHLPTVEVVRYATQHDADGLVTAVEMLRLQTAPLPEPTAAEQALAFVAP